MGRIFSKSKRRTLRLWYNSYSGRDFYPAQTNLVVGNRGCRLFHVFHNLASACHWNNIHPSYSNIQARIQTHKVWVTYLYFTKTYASVGKRPYIRALVIITLQKKQTVSNICTHQLSNIPMSTRSI